MQKKSKPQQRIKNRLLCFVLACILLIGAISAGFIVYNTDNTSISRTGEPISPEDRWTYGDSDDVFENAFEKFRTLVTAFGNVKAYFNDNEFTTVEDTMAYKEMWDSLSEDANAIQTILREKYPPKEYEDAWNAFAECAGQISSLLASFDPEYTANETAVWISEVSYEFNSLSNEVWELTNELIEINKTIIEVTDSFFLQIKNSEYQPVAKYKVTLTGMISSESREIELVTFEYISGDECEPGYEIDGDTVSVTITHPTEGCLLRIFSLNASGEFIAS